MIRRDGSSRGTKPTLHDVAARAGVSIATASNVLNGSRYVSPERTERVMAAADQLGYRINGIAASLRSRKSRLIGMVVPDITNAFFSGLVHGIEELAAGSGYQIMLVSTNEDPARERDRVYALLSRRADGLIVVPTIESNDVLDEIRGEEARTVAIDRVGGIEGIDTIAIDNVTAAENGTRHLIDLGHQDIAFLLTTDRLENIRGRVEGYRRALRRAGLAGRERLVVGGMTAQSSCRAVLEHLAADPRPTAIFAANNLMTLGTIKALRSAGIDCPDDVSLLGFDDFEWMTVLRPSISTVRQPVEEMAANAWRLLIDRLAGREHAVEHLRLPCEVCVRESTRPPRKPH